METAELFGRTFAERAGALSSRSPVDFRDDLR
jgi:hypothetical protein